ncbi:MAG: NosD domain-containing protein, partial [Candidatus Thermoplasmatota archaeon]|nr:NosD domain-containing protein [Candidatus Thermoplasmatota archaeon]
IKIPLITLVLFSLLLPNPPSSFAKNKIQAEGEINGEILGEQLFQESEFPLEPSIPGRIEKTGTYFEIRDSEYLNITLKSTEEIKIVLESIPRMISMDIEAAKDNINSTELTIGGLKVNETYYKYQDSYKNETVFVSDGNGNYSWRQDLSQPHHIWIQEKRGTIFIPDDCSKYGIWDEATRTCTLNRDLTESVEFTSDNIILDCQTRNITGDQTSYGIYLNGKTSVVIKSCIISNFSVNLGLFNSSGNTISNNNCYNGKYTCLSLGFSNNNTILNNNFSHSKFGIWLSDSSNNNLLNNTISNNSDQGLSFYGSSNNNRMLENNCKNNYHGVIIHSSGNIISENVIVGNQSGIFCRSENNTFYGNNIKGNRWGILLYPGSGNNTIWKNSLTGNTTEAIFLWKSSRNRILENSIKSNFWFGIGLSLSKDNIISKNDISDHIYGIYFGYGAYPESRNNLVSKNNITRNGYGIYLRYSYENQIFHNNFIHNGRQAVIYSGLDNIFDNGYPDGGNYWSDYTGVDLHSGPNQDQPGSDGIGDTPYISRARPHHRIIDRYPFMEESGWEKPRKWSFAIITDIHLGRGYPDYDGESYDDGYGGEDYYLSERLKKAIDWINENKNNIKCDGTPCPIQFVAVLGDITD